MNNFFNDVRYAARVLRRSPGLTAAAVLTLTLGIGANATMFSVVKATLLEPPPFPEVERLMTLWQGPADDGTSLSIVSYPNFRDWAERSRSFEQLALFDSAGRGYNLSGGGEGPEQVSGVRVTAGFFPALGVEPLLGRTFLADEEERGLARVVVLSHGLWQRRYGSDPSLVGSTIPIDSQSYTVVGVMPASFRFQFGGGRRELWVPTAWNEGDRERSSRSFIALGRLARGVTVDQARAEMDLIGRALAEEYPETNRGETARVVPATEYGIGSLRTSLLALLAIVGVVLLIACVNVANLMLSQAAARHRELAIRGALGAQQGRIVRQLLTESLILALAGGACGVLASAAGVRLLPQILPRALINLPLRPLDGIPLDLTVLAFTFSVSLLAGVLFGLAPALTSARSDLVEPLKESARGSSRGGSRLRYALVSFEVGLTIVVLAGAGLLITSLSRLLDVDPGLEPRNVLVMSMSLPQENLYYGPPGDPLFCESLEREVGNLPGVLSVSGIAHLPLSGARAGRAITIEGRPAPEPDNQPGGGYSVACPGYLETLGIPLVAGREFTHRDALGAPGVVLINESMADRYWPDEDPVGKRFKLGRADSDDPWLTIVGVHGDIRHTGLAGDPYPWFLRPYPQAGWPFFSIVTKTASEPRAFTRSVEEALARVEPEQAVRNVRTLEEVLSGSVGARRFPMQLLSLFAVLSLALAAVGIAGVVSFTVVQRRQEIGIRLALGASARQVLSGVIAHSMRWTLLGLIAGLAASIGLLRFLDSLLFDVSHADVQVLGLASAVLVGVALAASYVPARRATRLDPVKVLRSE